MTCENRDLASCDATSHDNEVVCPRRPADRDRPVIEEARQLARGTNILVRDHRRLGVEVTGAPGGSPVFLLHGTPGSRLGPKPRGPMLYRMGVRLISYDRPGYGQSTRQMDRTVVDAASDVEFIANKLGLDRFSVLGRSGGGPHALACAAVLGDRVDRTGVMVSLARPDADDLNWYEGMTDSNTQEFGAAVEDVGELIARLQAKADRARIDPETIVNALEAEMTAADRRVVYNVAMRDQLRRSYAEAVVQRAAGWIDDVLALRSDWGFKLADVQGEVRFWHGVEDPFAPATHTRALAREIRDAVVDIELGAAHFGAFGRAPDMINWLVGGKDTRVRTSTYV